MVLYFSVVRLQYIIAMALRKNKRKTWSSRVWSGLGFCFGTGRMGGVTVRKFGRIEGVRRVGEIKQ
jgi:hypothetical protein